jgi:hypothetical protein
MNGENVIGYKIIDEQQGIFLLSVRNKIIRMYPIFYHIFRIFDSETRLISLRHENEKKGMLNS